MYHNLKPFESIFYNMLKKIVPLFFILFSCQTNHLFVQVENIGLDYLASAYVKTPDFRQEQPPYGQKIHILWNFPKNLYYQNLSINLRVRFWDNSEENLSHKINKRFGSISFFFKNPLRLKQKNILTYRVQIMNDKEEIVETWNHQLWTELINIDQENDEEIR